MKRPFKRKEAAGAVPRRRQPGDTPVRPSSAELSDRYAFRRNRTLTGSSSAHVASSNELNAELRSPRAHVHHLTSLRRRLLAYFVVAAGSAFALYLLVSQLVAVTTVQVAGVTLTTNSPDVVAYQQAIDRYYAARPTERLRFLLNEQELTSHLQAIRPEIQAVSVEPGGGLGEASVRLVARKPIARWSMDGGNKYVDTSGVVFDKNYYPDPTLQIIDNSGVQASANRLVASNRFLGFVGRVIAGSSANGMPVSTVTIPALTTRQVTLSLEGKGTVYKLSVDRSEGQQVEDIMRIDRYLAQRKLTPEYVDVRISGKAFYK